MISPIGIRHHARSRGDQQAHEPEGLTLQTPFQCLLGTGSTHHHQRKPFALHQASYVVRQSCKVSAVGRHEVMVETDKAFLTFPRAAKMQDQIVCMLYLVSNHIRVNRRKRLTRGTMMVGRLGDFFNHHVSTRDEETFLHRGGGMVGPSGARKGRTCR